MSRYRECIYDNYTASFYANVNRFDQASYDCHSRIYMGIYGRLLPPDKNARILDVGCGTGFFLYALKQAGYTNVEGIDISEDQVEIARSQGLNASVADGLNFLDTKKDEYDMIMCMDILEHLTKDELVSAVMLSKQALRPGGRFMCTVPNANSPLAGRIRYIDLSHEQIFTDVDLAQLLMACGLTIEYLGDEHIRPFTLKGWIRHIFARMFRWVWGMYMLAEMGKDARRAPLGLRLLAVARK